MFHFALSDEERLIQETARHFAQDRVQPGRRTHETARGLPAEVVSEFAALGLATIDLPVESGGQGLGAFVRALVLEELAAVDPGAALVLDGLGPALPALVAAGIRPHGLRGVAFEDVDETCRVRGGRVEGEHAWVPADRLDVAVIFQDERAFVVEEGFALTPLRACGLEAAGASRVVFAGAPVAAVVDDPRALARVRAAGRTAVGALLVGAARGAYAYARQYAMERTAFGRPIAHHQALAFLIADLATAVDVARLGVWRAAAALDAGATAAWEAASALAEAAEQALFVGPNAVQILGGHGFMKDHPVEKWMRDIRTLAQLGGGRDEAELAAATLVSAHEIDLR